MAHFFSQIKAVDNGRPQKSSTCRLHIEWIPKPEVPADAAPLRFEEFPFIFSVMESDPVAHMVGVVATESSDVPVWFEITGSALFMCCIAEFMHAEWMLSFLWLVVRQHSLGLM